MADRTIDFLIVGGGIAGGNCARWLRRSGADGSILLVGREPHLPYDRPPLSKGYLQGKESVDDALMQESGWYEDQGIEALTKVSAMKLDTQARTVKLSNREQVGFGQLLLATGANVKRLRVDGDQFDGIHYLRTFANSDAIRAEAAGKRVVLIGGSYIASEVAATLTELGAQCSMVMLEPVALSRTFGLEAGRYFHDLLAGHGIELLGEDELERFEGADGRVSKVVTQSGRELDSDAVVIGAGVGPDVMLARGAGLELGESGGIRIDSQLRTSVPGRVRRGRRRRVLERHPRWCPAARRALGRRLRSRQDRCSEHARQGGRPRRRAVFLLRPVGLGRDRVRRPGAQWDARWSAARWTRTRSRSSTSRTARLPARCRSDAREDLGHARRRIDRGHGARLRGHG